MREFLRRLAKGDAPAPEPEEPPFTPEESARWLTALSVPDLMEIIDTSMIFAHGTFTTYRQNREQASLDEVAALTRKTTIAIDELNKRLGTHVGSSRTTHQGSPPGTGA